MGKVGAYLNFADMRRNISGNGQPQNTLPSSPLTVPAYTYATNLPILPISMETRLAILQIPRVGAILGTKDECVCGVFGEQDVCPVQREPKFELSACMGSVLDQWPGDGALPTAFRASAIKNQCRG